MKFIPVSADELPNFREGRRGRISYPICKGFLESGHLIAKLDRTDLGKTANHLKMLLGWYVKGHKLPIKLVTRMGELYMVRTDVKDGKIDPNWKWEDTLPQAPPEDEAPDIDMEEINRKASSVAPPAKTAPSLL